MAAAVSSAQIRAGRAMLNWSLLDLADAARLSVATVKRVQDGNPSPPVDGAAEAIRDALEARGIRFLADDGNGPGVRFKAT